MAGEVPPDRARYERSRRAVNDRLLTSLAAALLAASVAAPARATSVAEVLAAVELLQVPPGMDEAAWRAHRAAHEAEMQRAHATLALAHAVQETVLAVHHAALARYGVVLMCNYDEETRPSFPELAEAFVAEGARRHGLDPAEARPRLLQADIEEMLATTLLDRYRCPAGAVSAPGSPPTAPAR